MAHLWTWWVGALALGSVAVGYTLATRRPFGVSGHVGRAVSGEDRPTSVLFLGGVVIGGLLAALSSSGLSVQGLDTSWTHYFGSGPAAFLALVGGGGLVGAGTALAGGCTSGHGLVGCSRIQPGSLAATASFFGTAVAVSFLLAQVIP